MSPVLLVLTVAALTYASRAAPLVVLPAPTGRLRTVADRLPAPLFAGLVVLTLFGPDLDAPPAPMLLAAVAALAVTPRRSLALVLVAGLGAYTAAALWWS